MGAGQGNQTISLAYLGAGTTSDVNKYLSDILKTGIYSGGEVTPVSGDDVQIAPFTLLIKCTTGELVKVKTTTNVTLTVSEAEPYIVYRLDWLNVENNFGVFRKDSDDGNFNGNNICANEIVFGKAEYVAHAINSISTTNRTFPLMDANGDVWVKRDIKVVRNAEIDGILTCGDDIIIPSVQPASPSEGSLYIDFAGNKLYVYNGSTWKYTALS